MNYTNSSHGAFQFEVVTAIQVGEDAILVFQVAKCGSRLLWWHAGRSCWGSSCRLISN